MAMRGRPVSSHQSSARESGYVREPPVTPAANGHPGPAGERERGRRSRLPRAAEPFHRVYSPPEAPRARTRRRPGVTGVLITTFTVLAVAAVAVAVLASRREASRPGTAPAPPHPTAVRSPAADTPRTAGAPVFASVPTACQILPPDTVRRLVPTDTPTIDKMGGATAGVCEYSLTEGRRYRAVRVDSRAFLPEYMHDQAMSMTIWSFEAQWRQAEKDLTADTSSLRRIGGLGDAAFERYWIDRDAHVAVGEATVRHRNVVLRVQYTEEEPSAKDRSAGEQRCLAAAISAARAGLAAFGSG